jgi:hypothetical protein
MTVRSFKIVPKMSDIQWKIKILYCIITTCINIKVGVYIVQHNLL